MLQIFITMATGVGLSLSKLSVLSGRP